MKERKRKRREQRTKESIKSILFKRRFTHLTNGDTKRLQRRWNSISLTRHPLKFHPDQRDHIFESIYIPLRSVNKYLCGYLYIYIYLHLLYIYIYIKYRIYHHVWRRCLAVKSANAYIWYPVSRDREAWADPKPIFWQLFHEFVSAALGFHSSRLAYGITRQRRYIATTAFSFVTRILLYST